MQCWTCIYTVYLYVLIHGLMMPFRAECGKYFPVMILKIDFHLVTRTTKRKKTKTGPFQLGVDGYEDRSWRKRKPLKEVKRENELLYVVTFVFIAPFIHVQQVHIITQIRRHLLPSPTPPDASCCSFVLSTHTHDTHTHFLSGSQIHGCDM